MKKDEKNQRIRKQEMMRQRNLKEFMEVAKQELEKVKGLSFAELRWKRLTNKILEQKARVEAMGSTWLHREMSEAALRQARKGLAEQARGSGSINMLTGCVALVKMGKAKEVSQGLQMAKGVLDMGLAVRQMAKMATETKEKRKEMRKKEKRLRKVMCEAGCPACLQELEGWEGSDKILEELVECAQQGKHIHHGMK